jgi:pSer/pThr/pTyr-binding forkhead associated (FHA) protein
MVQLKILSGKKAGATWVARRFPVRIGRSAAADLCLEEDGVWEQHLLLQRKPAEGWVLTAQGEALASVNGLSVREAVLRNGDKIQIGAAELQFWLAEARQRALGLREALTWGAIGAVCLSQIALLYWLLR